MFVTHVKNLGNFLKIYGQINKSEAAEVELAVNVLKANLVPNHSAQYQQLDNSSVVMVKRENDQFYRCKILKARDTGLLAVLLIDYGYELDVKISEIHLLNYYNTPAAEFLKTAKHQASEFIISRVFLGTSIESAVEVIQQIICNTFVNIHIDCTVESNNLISIDFRNIDFSNFLIAKNLALAISLEQQKDVIVRSLTNALSIPRPLGQSQSITENNLQTQHPGRVMHSNIPDKSKQMILTHLASNINTKLNTTDIQPHVPYGLQPHATMINNLNQPTIDSSLISRNPFIHSQTANKIYQRDIESQNLKPATHVIPTFKSNDLMIGSKHIVYCCYIKDGPNLFSVQLKSTEEDLDHMMAELGNVPLKCLSEKPVLGMACIARYSEDKQLYRAVIMNIMHSECQVAYIDYGNTETVSYVDIYEIPEEFLRHTIFAIRFTLSGYKEITSMNENIKKFFKALVMDKELELVVMPVDGPIFVQYCELYCNSVNVLTILKNKLSECPTYTQPTRPNEKEFVVIRYVESPQKFFVQQTANILKYEQMMDKLSIYGATAVPLKNAQVGAACTARFNQEPEWYRVQILNIKGQCALIQFVDFGITNETNIKELRTISLELLTMPRQAIECCLDGFQNVTLSELARDQLELLAEDSAGDRRNFKIKIMNHLPNDVLLVNLQDESTSPPLDLSNRMFKLSMPPKTFRYYEQQKFQKVEQSQPIQEDSMHTNNINIINSSKITENLADNNSTSNWDDSITNNHENSRHNSNDNLKKNSHRDTVKTSSWDDSRNSQGNSKNSSYDHSKNTSQRDNSNKTNNWDDSEHSHENFRKLTRTDTAKTSSWDDSQQNNENTKNMSYNNNARKVSNGDSGKISNRDDSSNSHYSNNKSNKYDKSIEQYGNRYSNANTSKVSNDSSGVVLNNDGTQSSNCDELSSDNWNDKAQSYPNSKSNTNWRNNDDTSYKDHNKREERRPITNDFNKRDRYPGSTNIKNSIPRFNKQNNIKGFNKNNSYDSKRNFNNSDSSGKYSQSTRKFDDFANTTQHTDEFETEEFISAGMELSKAKINLNEKIKVILCWWISPSEFYVYFKHFEKEFEDMMNKMQTFYKDKTSMFDNPEIGSYVIAKNNKDTIFYRAKILAYNEQLKKFKVQFIDLGNKSIVTLNDIWEMEIRFSKLQQMAIKCHLDNVVPNFDRAEIQDKIDNYITANKDIECKFIVEQNENSFTVNIDVDEINLKESLLNDGIISVLAKGVELNRLIGQTLIIHLVSIKDLSCFHIQLFDCDTKFLCSYKDLNAVKQTQHLSSNFKESYENKSVPARIENVSSDNILIVTPLITLLNASQIPDVCHFPVLSNIISVVITHIELINIVYVQNSGHADMLAEFLDELYNFYEENGVSCDNISPTSLCAAKSADGNWYRARIESVLDNDVIVRYIDYGNCESVPRNNIKNLHINFQNLSLYAIKAYLPLHCAYCDNETVSDEVTNLTKGYQLSLKVLEYYNNNWIVDISSSGYSLISVLKEKGFGDYVHIDKIKEQIDSDCFNLSNVQNDGLLAVENNVQSNIVDDVLTTIENKTSPNGIPAFISHTDRPDRFYLNLESQQNDLEKLQEDLQIVAPSLKLLEDFNVGTQCIVKYSVDDNWYRAVIIDSDSEITSIQFIDYGNTDTITDNNLIKTMNEAFIDMKPYAIACSLPLETKDGSEWCDEACNLLQELSLDTVTFEYICQTENTCYVNLYAGYRDIVQELQDKTYAVKMEIVNNGENCFVSHINSLDNFYIQMESDTNRLEMISGYLVDNEKFDEITEFTVGTMCTAQFIDDEQWYRAKILKYEPDNIEVAFVDYGNTSVATNLRCLPADIAEIPYLSKKCSLRMPKEIQQWSEEAENTFQEIADMGAIIFSVNLICPGKRAIVDLLIDSHNILENLVKLCEKRDIPTLVISDIEEDIVEPAPVHNENISHEAFIIIYESANSFYVQLDSRTAEEKNMVELMQNAGNFSKLLKIHVGDICAACYDADGAYYRAKVLSIEGEEEFVVRFIDYGNTSTTNELLGLPKNIASIEKLAIHCTLEKPSKPWSNAAHKTFLNLEKNEIKVYNIEILDSNCDPCIVRVFQNGLNIHTLLESCCDDNENESHLILADIITNVNNHIDNKELCNSIIYNALEKAENHSQCKNIIGTVIEDVLETLMISQRNDNDIDMESPEGYETQATFVKSMSYEKISNEKNEPCEPPNNVLSDRDSTHIKIAEQNRNISNESIDDILTNTFENLNINDYEPKPKLTGALWQNIHKSQFSHSVSDILQCVKANNPPKSLSCNSSLTMLPVNSLAATINFGVSSKSDSNLMSSNSESNLMSTNLKKSSDMLSKSTEINDNSEKGSGDRYQ